MSETDTHTHRTLSKEEARAGQTTGHVRVILIISSVLAVIVLGAILLAFVR